MPSKIVLTRSLAPKDIVIGTDHPRVEGNALDLPEQNGYSVGQRVRLRHNRKTAIPDHLVGGHGRVVRIKGRNGKLVVRLDGDEPGAARTVEPHHLHRSLSAAFAWAKSEFQDEADVRPIVRHIVAHHKERGLGGSPEEDRITNHPEEMGARRGWGYQAHQLLHSDLSHDEFRRHHFELTGGHDKPYHGPSLSHTEREHLERQRPRRMVEEHLSPKDRVRSRFQRWRVDRLDPKGQKATRVIKHWETGEKVSVAKSESVRDHMTSRHDYNWHGASSRWQRPSSVDAKVFTGQEWRDLHRLEHKDDDDVTFHRHHRSVSKRGRMADGHVTTARVRDAFARFRSLAPA